MTAVLAITSCTSMKLVLIPVLPAKCGIISNTFWVETWFLLLYLGGYFYHLTWDLIGLTSIFMVFPTGFIRWVLLQRPPGILEILPYRISLSIPTGHHFLNVNLRLFCSLLFRTVLLMSKGVTNFLLIKEIFNNSCLPINMSTQSYID